MASLAGTSGRFEPELVASLNRNKWQVWPEYAYGSWTDHISPGFLTSDDFNRVCRSETPFEDYSFEGFLHFPANDVTLSLIHDSDEVQFRAYSNISAIDNLEAEINILTENPYSRRLSYGTNSNMLRIELHPPDRTYNTRYQALRIFGDPIQYRNGTVYFDAYPYLPFILDIKEMQQWTHTWRMAPVLIQIEFGHSYSRTSR